MEADWEIEIGDDAPVIEADWSDFVDLRLSPERVRELAEVREIPAIADALVHLNAKESPVWTSKCDVWPVAEIDPYELNAPPESATCALACYIDLLPGANQHWLVVEDAVQWCSGVCEHLRSILLDSCRADFIVRRAFVGAQPGLGITAYLMACGPTRDEVTQRLASALAVFADFVVNAVTLTLRLQRYNGKKWASSSTG